MKDEGVGRGRQRTGAYLVRAQCVSRHDLDLGGGEREMRRWRLSHTASCVTGRSWGEVVLGG